MSRQVVTMPSSISGIKRLAKKIKAEDGLPLQVSQNIAAQRCGFENFRHASSSIKNAPSKVKMIYITTYWKNDDDSGRLTLGVPLSCSISQFLSAQQVRFGTPRLVGFKLEFKDHIERIHDATDETDAREAAMEAASALQFVQLTGLMGLTRKQQMHQLELFRDLPGRDHMSGWAVPGEPDKWVAIDEPYSEFDRKKWAVSQGIGSAPAWNQGIYRGGLQPATVFAQTQEYANEIAGVLARISYRKAEITTTTEAYDSVFTSPSRASAGGVKRPRPMPTPVNTVRGRCVAYGDQAGEYSNWRPVKPLPMVEHLKVGPILEALRYAVPYRSQLALWTATGTLCNWFFLEYGNVITDKIEFTYNSIGEGSPTADQQKALITADLKCAALEEVVAIILKGYQPCAPLTAVIKKLRLVMDHVRKSTQH